MRFNHPYLIASGVLILFWLLYRILAGTWNPLKVACGADGRPSTSKLQFWLWTLVVLFSYVVIYSARVNNGRFDAINELPANLLIAMGLSIVTATAAKGITVSYLQSGSLVKTPSTPGTSGMSQVVRNDDGSLDLSKIQMLAWTLIAIGVYLVNVANTVKQNQFNELPDIDAALMVLMGLGQGAYLGKKLVTTDVPRITGVAPQTGGANTVITIQGDTFGKEQNGSVVTVDGQPINVPVDSWSDTQIKFKLPAKHPNGSAWSQGQQMSISLIVGGKGSATSMPFTVA
jgi:hypothetical protein